MSNLTQVGSGGVERPDVALEEDLIEVKSKADAAKQTADSTASFLETRVPRGRTINNIPMDTDIVLTPEVLNTYSRKDIDDKIAAMAAGGYNPVRINGYLLDRDVILSASDVGAPTAQEVDDKLANKVPTSRKINGKPLTSDITIDLGDSAYSKSEVDQMLGAKADAARTINGKPLTSDIEITAEDIGAASAADYVPRTFRINNKAMTGVDITITASDIGAIDSTVIDEKMGNYLKIHNRYGLGIAPELITSSSFSEMVEGSGFYEYGPGTEDDGTGTMVPTSVSDRPTGSTTGRVIILTNPPVRNTDGAITTPASQDLLAFPSDIDGVFVKKSGYTVWSKIGGASEGAPLPQLWAPLSDSLALVTGEAAFDTLTIGGETVDLNTKSVNFTRASAATYIGKDGVLNYADVDEPRFETPGLLIEGQSTNYFRYSNDPSQWKTTGNTAASMTVTTINDGNTKAPTGVFTLNTAGPTLTLVGHTGTPMQVVVGDTVSASCRVKIPSTCRVRVRYGNSTGYVTGIYYDSTGVIIGTEEKTVNNSAVLDSDGYLTIKSSYVVEAVDTNFTVTFLVYDVANVNNNIAAGAVFYLQMPQVELAVNPTSFIVTGSAPATRAADVVSVSALNGGKGSVTISCEVNRNWQAFVPNTAPRVFSTRGSVASQAWDASVTSTTANNFGGTSNAGSSVSGYTSGQLFTGIKTATGLGTITPSGKLIGNQGVSPGFGNALYLGNSKELTRPLNGHIRNFRIWHKVLSDDQIKGLA